MAPSPAKPFKEYCDLVALLKARGMIIPDENLAEEIISQVGYYRLSGFWYPTRKLNRDSTGVVITNSITNNPERKDDFEEGVSFDKVFSLYLFDKRLRILFIDAIEQIEINLRSIIAHELSRHNPMAYKDSSYIDSKKCKTWTDKKGKTRNLWAEWETDSESKLKRSKEDCINWHRSANKEIPFWVAIEAWDFGTLSRYFSMLKGAYKNLIASRLNVSNPKNLETWLREINTLRNRCAHHTRIWNQGLSSPLHLIGETKLSSLGLGSDAKKKGFGLTAVIWFLLKNINGESDWIYDWIELVEQKPDLPGCTYTSMGFPNPNEVPLDIIDL